jgi:hypothetical protein
VEPPRAIARERGGAVFIDDADPECLRLWSVTAPPSSVWQLADPDIAQWQRNRASDLAGFKTDGRGRAIGEAWVPRAGLDADEWAAYVQAVATACDRLEYLLTGRDEG